MSPILLQQLVSAFCIFMFSSILAKVLANYVKRTRPRPIYRGITSLEDAVLIILRKNDICHREELEEWCGGKSREPFYTEVRKVTPLRWQMVPDPKKYVRDVYQAVLPGYTNARIKTCL